MSRKLFLLIGLVLVLSAAGNASAALIGHWAFNEGSGTLAADTSGNGNDGTLQGNPRWVAGKLAGAIEFDGVDDFVGTGKSLLDNASAFTMAGWVSARNPGASRIGLFGQNDLIEMGFMNGNVEVWTAASGTTNTPWAFPNDSWHHIAVVSEGTSMMIYLDGQLKATGSGSSSYGTSAFPFNIGGGGVWDSSGNWFSGSIDDVQLYSHALTAQEIPIIMLGLGGYPYASSPDPADGATVAATWANLAWRAGDFAVSHNVYLGESFADVNAGAANVLRVNQTDTFFTIGIGVPGDPYPAGLVPGTTYYWRVDEVNTADPNSPWKGPIWSFTVPSQKAYNPVPADGSKFIDATGVTLSWTPGFGARLHYVYFGDKLETVSNATGGLPQGTATYKPTGLQPAKTYYWRVDEFDAAKTYKGDVWSFTTGKTGGGVIAQYYKGMNFETLTLTRTDPQINFSWGAGAPDPAVGADNFSVRWTGEVEAAFTETYTFYARADDGVRLWVNDQQLVDAWIDQGATEYSGKMDLVAGNTYNFVMEMYENGGDAVAELRWSSPRTPKQLIPSAALSPAVKASSPRPANGATSISQTPLLQWNAGIAAASHEVYFGADPNAIKNATKTSPEYKGTQARGSESYAPAMLDWKTTYYWRIDEVNNTNPASPWVGNVWSFTTADYGVVDDFEYYNDIAAGQPGSNLVYATWKDGFGTTTNGSTMGYPTGASLDTANVHGGTKAAPLIYNNATASLSEVERTFAVPQNWTDHGIQTLSLWFRGDAANVPGQLYVKINDVKVPYDGDASNLKKPIWQTWNVTLSSVATNLQSVTKLAVGIETKGATGTLLLDDIRLYPLPRQLVTPVQPDPNGLVASFAFEGNVNDSAGGHNGTANGGPTYGAGKISQAIVLDGVDEYVVIGSVGISGAAPRSIAGWAKVSALTWPAWIDVFGFTGPSGNNGHFDIELVGDSGTNATLGWYGLHVYGWERNILPADSEWHHLAATYDGAAIKWYGDGLLVGSDTRVLATPDNVHIGKRQDNTNFFPGSVDEVRIFSRVLSEAEIAGLAGATLPFDKPF